MAVGVGEMHVADPRPTGSQRRRHVGLLDVHVKKIREDLHVARAQGADGGPGELRDLRGAVVRAVADADEQQAFGLRPAART